MTAFERICADVGMTVVGEALAETAVLELLPAVKMTRTDALRRPRVVAAEISAYLDDVMRNP